jgi:hypothetical protein
MIQTALTLGYRQQLAPPMQLNHNFKEGGYRYHIKNHVG